MNHRNFKRDHEIIIFDTRYQIDYIGSQGIPPNLGFAVAFLI